MKALRHRYMALFQQAAKQPARITPILARIQACQIHASCGNIQRHLVLYIATCACARTFIIIYKRFKPIWGRATAAVRFKALGVDRVCQWARLRNLKCQDVFICDNNENQGLFAFFFFLKIRRNIILISLKAISMYLLLNIRKYSSFCNLWPKYLNILNDFLLFFF